MGVSKVNFTLDDTHEINNILTVIVGYAELLNIHIEHLTEKEQRYVKEILTQSDRLVHFFRDKGCFSNVFPRDPEHIE
jgi:signal transduction histidine kinase